MGKARRRKNQPMAVRPLVDSVKKTPSIGTCPNEGGRTQAIYKAGASQNKVALNGKTIERHRRKYGTITYPGWPIFHELLLFYLLEEAGKRFG